MYTPLGEYVLVKLDENGEQVTQSGLVVARTQQEALSYGTVVAVGEGAVSQFTSERLPMEVSTDDRVLFPTYAGTEVTIDGDKFKLIRQSDLIAKEN